MKFSQQGEPAGDQPLAAKPVINAKLAKITDALLAAMRASYAALTKILEGKESGEKAQSG